MPLRLIALCLLFCRHVYLCFTNVSVVVVVVFVVCFVVCCRCVCCLGVVVVIGVRGVVDDLLL